MKTVRRSLVGLLLALFLSCPVFAGDSVVGSGAQTASASLVTGAGLFHGIMLATDGTNAVTLDIYDNTAASGTKLIPQVVISTAASNRVSSISINPAIQFSNGIYVDITCAGTVGYVIYTSGRN